LEWRGGEKEGMRKGERCMGGGEEENGEREKRKGEGKEKEREDKERGRGVFASVKIKSWVRPRSPKS